MVFSNLIFLYLFLPLNIILYYLSKNKTYRNLVLILFSLLFYAWGEPVWVFVLMFSVGVDFCNGRIIERSRGRLAAKLALALSVGVNLSLLGLFKYSGFLVSSVNAALGLALPVPQFILPIGISFYSFQAISYVVDVYRGDVAAQKSYYKLLMYVSLYPQLVAGPIVRYSQIAAEVDDRRTTSQDVSLGLTRMLCGLTKKVLIANVAGKLLEGFTGAPAGTLSVAGAWFGMLLFGLQIYYDFSGYSDMAIGLGQVFGFHYQENFNYPYISRSVTEFWRRWHISLSSFFRDYVYIPLGGNRRRQYLNLFIVWFLTGLWHGPSWNFVLWGLYFGVFIALERLFLSKVLGKLPALFSHLYLLLVALLGWTLFYFEDFGKLRAYLGVMFGLSGAPLWDSKVGLVILNNLLWLTVALLFCLPVVPHVKAWIARYASHRQMVLVRLGETAMNLVLLFLCTSLLVGQSFNPFLYFRF